MFTCWWNWMTVTLSVFTKVRLCLYILYIMVILQVYITYWFLVSFLLPISLDAISLVCIVRIKCLFNMYAMTSTLQIKPNLKAIAFYCLFSFLFLKLWRHLGCHFSECGEMPHTLFYLLWMHRLVLMLIFVIFSINIWKC